MGAQQKKRKALGFRFVAHLKALASEIPAIAVLESGAQPSYCA